jgi:tetratricopeptide (TPR) repeat protein
MKNLLIKNSQLLICLFLIASITTAYLDVRHHQFISFDDGDYITNNQVVKEGLTTGGIIWAFTETHVHNWHPLTWISHMLDVQFFGLDAGRHKLVNVILHILNALLLFLILNRVTKALWRSAFVAVLFALHPLHVESIAWVAERKDVLSTFFWMLTMGAYVYYVERPAYQRYLIVLVFFAFGLMAKPMLVTLPFVLLLLDYWPLNRLRQVKQLVNIFPDTPRTDTAKNKKRKIKKDINYKTMQANQQIQHAGNQHYSWPVIRPVIVEKIPLFVLAAVSIVITIYAQHQVIKTTDQFPLDVRMANALISYVLYLGKMFWPTHLAIFYPHEGQGFATSWMPWMAAFCLILVTVLVIWLKKQRYLVVGWLWYMGTLIPVIGIVQVGVQAMADRYTYIPLIGIFLMIAWGIPDSLKHCSYRKVALALIGGAVTVILTAMTYSQVKHWTNSTALYSHAVEVTSNNRWAYYNLGLSLVEQGDFTGASYHFHKALLIKPNDFEAINNLGIIAIKNNDMAEAIARFSEALQINPGYVKARNNIGFLLFNMGKNEEAIIHFNESLRMVPENPDTHHLLGMALTRNGYLDEAIKHYLVALRLKPDHIRAHNSIGIVLARKGQINQAIDHFRDALRINPQFEEARRNLNTALSQKQNAQ